MSTATQTPAEPFFFGPRGCQLFGALHDAETYAPRECGVVICYPFGQEYVRSHRACRHLALRLASAGFPVLRFDYGGTGDSAGEAEDARLAAWRDDIGHAVAALRARAGVESVCLIGLRLGASLALEVAGERGDVAGLVLWEPVVAGQNYLAELAEQHRSLLWRFFDKADHLVAGPRDELLGFPVSAALRDELGRLDLLTIPPFRRGPVLLVESQSDPALARLHDLLRGQGADVAHRQIPSFATWREDVDKGLVPDPVLRGITAWAAEVLR